MLIIYFYVVITKKYKVKKTFFNKVPEISELTTLAGTPYSRIIAYIHRNYAKFFLV